VDSFCDKIDNLLNSFSKLVCPDLGRILKGLTPLVNILEAEYGGRVDRGCNLYS
jgi:hypothetical protein